MLVICGVRQKEGGEDFESCWCFRLNVRWSSLSLSLSRLSPDLVLPSLVWAVTTRALFLSSNVFVLLINILINRNYRGA